jgi:hypothetical protein
LNPITVQYKINAMFCRFSFCRIQQNGYRLMHRLCIIFNSVHEVSVPQILPHFWHYERQILDLKIPFQRFMLLWSNNQYPWCRFCCNGEVLTDAVVVKYKSQEQAMCQIRRCGNCSKLFTEIHPQAITIFISVCS